jgi:hypothetical protein
MDPDTAKLVFFIVMGIAVVVWIWSLAKALRLGRRSTRADRLTFDDFSEFETQTGEVVVRGEQAAVSSALKKSFQQPGLATLGALYKIMDWSADRLTLEKMGSLVSNQPPGLYFSEAEFTIAPAGSDMVRVSYDLGYTRIIRLLRKIALCVIFLAGLPTIVVVGSVIWFYVVQSEDPAVRWQTFQVVHVGHALWPPFLIMWFYRVGWRNSRAFVENLIASVEVDD